jgi:hypothetical protein
VRAILLSHMTGRNEIVIGNKGANYVSLAVGFADREGWSKAEIDVHCDGWAGTFRGSFLKGELARFAQEILALHQDPVGTARLRPIEAGLALMLTGDGKGHVTVDGVARTDSARETQLRFRIDIDQTYLRGIAGALQLADAAPKAEKL